MTNMNKFAAQQLTKNQMTDVKGGGGGFDNCGRLFLAVWVGGSNYVCENDRAAVVEFVRAGAELLLVN